ncbi:MAG: hypothetical protein Q4Q23_01840 [Methanobacteriaceae archaeon]|nr:hypothetical protein [Methanobacteriaceae archaeon]
MLDSAINKEWKIDFFKIFSENFQDKEELKKADKLKIEHFSPVIGKYQVDMSIELLKELCNGNMTLTKAPLVKDYNKEILDIDYEKAIISELNGLVKDQIHGLNHEDPNFLTKEEEDKIYSSHFPFLTIMKIVFEKETQNMDEEDIKKWKDHVNDFINNQIIYVIVTTYFTIKLYRNSLYTTKFITPYNSEEIWEKYANNQKGYCITYDFKELNTKNMFLMDKIFPLLYLNKDDNITKSTYNHHCASLFEEKELLFEEKEWVYIIYEEPSDNLYEQIDPLLNELFMDIFETEQIKTIKEKNYMKEDTNKFEYNYKKLINDLKTIIEDTEYQTNDLNNQFKKIENILPDTIIKEFKKPEGLYLGKEFSEGLIESFKEIAKENNITLFHIKKAEEKLFPMQIID